MQELTNADAIKAWGAYPQHLIETFGDEGDLTRQYLLNPVLFSLLGDVTNRHILDAGCGQGYLARLLARRGAQVTGIEPTVSMYEYAYQREQTEQLGIDYIQADLSNWRVAPTLFDAVVANMVLMDIPEYETALATCSQALKPGGALIISLLHPCFDQSTVAWQGQGCVAVRDYFQERVVKQTYGYFIHRTLSAYLNQIVRVGCMINQVIEPQLDASVAAQHNAERYASVPGYLVVSAIKRDSSTITS